MARGRPKAKLDWKKISLNGAIAVEAFLKGDIATSLREIDSAFEAFFNAPHNPKDLPKLLWYETGIRATLDAMRDSGLTLDLKDAKQIADKLDKFVTQTLEEANEFGTVHQDLLNPSAHPAAKTLTKSFPAFLRDLDKSLPKKPTDARRRASFKLAIRSGLIRAWRKDIDRYRPLISGLQGPIAETGLRIAAWLKHGNYIHTHATMMRNCSD